MRRQEDRHSHWWLVAFVIVLAVGFWLNLQRWHYIEKALGRPVGFIELITMYGKDGPVRIVEQPQSPPR